MTQNNVVKKELTVGIILLFVGTTIIPSTAQNIEKSSSRGNWLYVGGNGPGNYARIQDAIDNTHNKNNSFSESSLPLPHRSILISGNHDLTHRNGVSGGNGTKDNPFVISGWYINAQLQHPILALLNKLKIFSKFKILGFLLNIFNTPALDGIFIHNTDKYIIIKNNHILNFDTGIFLGDNENIVIENNNIEKCHSAVDFYYGENKNLTIRNNTINDISTYTIIGSDALIEYNTFKRCDIAVKCSDSVVQYNLFWYCGIGIGTWGPCFISHNECFECNVGIGCYWPPHACTILDNVIQQNSYAGIYCIEGSQPIIHGNNFFHNHAGVTYLGGPMVNATLNWWGSDTGPSGSGQGSGDSVSEDVDYVPWLTEPNPEAGR
jgi:parallel beta-helix repeat protein